MTCNGIMKDSIVISLGGSIIVPFNGDLGLIKMICRLLNTYSEDFRFFLVVGGGRTAREYIGYARELGADESYLDEIGIRCTRLNAMLLVAALGERAAPVVANDFDHALQLAGSYDVVVMGGTHPGHTTDAVAAMLCERCGGKRFVNATTVDGIYDMDPMKFPDARRFDEINTTDLLNMLLTTSAKAGPNVVIDPIAVRILARSGIKGYVVDGRVARDLEKAILGEDFDGTRIIPV